MINLIPDNIRASNRYAVRNTRLLRYTVVSIFTMISIMVITAVSILNMDRKESDLQAQADEQNQRLAAYKPLHAQGQQLSDQISTINTLLSRQITFSTLLPDIAKIMPPGAVLKQLDFSTNDILASSGSTTPSGSSAKTTGAQKPFVILAAVNDRSVATTLLENVKASKDLFSDADLVDVTQSTEGTSNDPSTANRYPYLVTINAYLKKLNSQKNAPAPASSTGNPQ